MRINQKPFLSNRRSIWLVSALVIVVAVLVILAVSLTLLRPASPWSTTDANAASPQSFVVGTDALLILKEQSGNVSVYPSNNNSITVTPRKHGTLVAPDPHDVHILYTRSSTAQGHDQLSVTTDPWLSNTDFVVSIPSTTAVQIVLNSGSIDAHAGHGLTASTGSGTISLDSVQGPINVHTESGDVTGNELSGPLTITAASGSIRLQKVSGQVNAQTWSGDVTVSASALAGTSRLQTQSGSVRFTGSLDPRGTYTMQTTNGDVDLTLPSNEAFLLQASTGSGTVQNDFGGNSTGSGPQAHLSLHTQNGSVMIVKAS
jgi:hypothetical protein